MEKSNRHLASIDWTEILAKIQDFATSELARASLGELSPCSSASEASQVLAEIEETRQVLTLSPRPFMESLNLFQTWQARLRMQAILKTVELKDVRHFCLECISLKETLDQHPDLKQISHLNSNLFDASEALSAIDQVMTPRGEIRSDASEKLYRLFKEKEALSKQVQSVLDRLVRDHEMESLLQDKYVTTREGRWVLPIKSGMQTRLGGIIHASSQSKQTVFMEPDAVVQLNNRIREIEVAIEEEIERLLIELSNYLHLKLEEIEIASQILEKMDIRFAQAQFAEAIEAQPVGFSSEKIRLGGLRHPLLVLAGAKVIANDLELDSQQRILLLSGPNAGGKTVLLKSLGLAAQMARCGLPICAEKGSELPFFKELIIAVGDSQSVDESLSTFAAHLKVLNQAVTAQGPQQLLLIDEICGSTDPEEGSALARSFISVYAKNEVFGLITSHLGPLKMGWEAGSGVLNGSMEFDTSQVRPTYRFTRGVSGESLAIQTAKGVGVAAQIIEQALEFMGPLAKKRFEALDEIAELKSDVRRAQQLYREEKKAAEALKLKYEKLLKDFDEEKARILDRELKKLSKEVDQMIAAARVDETFKKHQSLEQIKSQMPEIVKAGPSKPAEIKTARDFGERFPPGSKVYVPSLGQDGLIQSPPNSKGEVQILSGSLRLTLPWSELKAPHKPSNPTAQNLRKANVSSVGLVEGDPILDLRGKKVDEAIEELEIKLDQAMTNQESRIKIIHGHGTEALKKAVRTYLSRSTYVRKWKAGSPHGGGDGVTWVEIADQ